MHLNAPWIGNMEQINNKPIKIITDGDGIVVSATEGIKSVTFEQTDQHPVAKLIDSSVRMLDNGMTATNAIRLVEYACRTCYRSFEYIGEGSGEKLIRSCLARKHETPLEHVNFSFEVVCDRAVLAQWTRHRISSFNVESQRYCNYTKDKFDDCITIIKPIWFDDAPEDDRQEWINSVTTAAQTYLRLIAGGANPEQARSVLPNCTKTQFVWTANLREIRHFLELRMSIKADPEIRKLAHEVFELLINAGYGIFFEDLMVTQQN